MGLDSLVRSLAVSGVTLASSFAYHQPVLYSQDQPKTEQKEKDDGTYDEETIKLEGLTQEQIEEYIKQLPKGSQATKKAHKFSYDDLKKLWEWQWPGLPSAEKKQVTYERAFNSKSTHLRKKYVMQELNRWGLIYDPKTNPEGPISPERVFITKNVRYTYESLPPGDDQTGKYAGRILRCFPEELKKAVIEEMKYEGTPITKKTLAGRIAGILGSNWSVGGPYDTLGHHCRDPPGLGKKLGERYGLLIVDLSGLFGDYEKKYYTPESGLWDGVKYRFTERYFQNLLAMTKVEATAYYKGEVLGVRLPYGKNKKSDLTTLLHAIYAVREFAGQVIHYVANNLEPPLSDLNEQARTGFEVAYNAYLLHSTEVDERMGIVDSARAGREVINRINQILDSLGYELKKTDHPHWPYSLVKKEGRSSKK